MHSLALFLGFCLGAKLFKNHPVWEALLKEETEEQPNS